VSHTRAAGWVWDEIVSGLTGLVRGVRAEIKAKNLSLVAAGVGFYGLLAIFPALIAVVTLYGLVADPETISAQLSDATAALPSEASDLVTSQLAAVAAVDPGRLSVGLVVSLAATVWASAGGVRALATGLNLINGVETARGPVRRAASSLVLTLGAMVEAVVMLTLVAGFPVVVDRLGLDPVAAALAQGLRWLLLVAALGAGLAVLYRWAPDEPPARWRWVSWGTVAAIALWAIGSVGFSVYVDNFGSYNSTYGSIAAVIVLMLWLFLTAFAVLFGAVVDAVRDRDKDVTEATHTAR
jgi:membrane protein